MNEKIEKKIEKVSEKKSWIKRDPFWNGMLIGILLAGTSAIAGIMVGMVMEEAEPLYSVSPSDPYTVWDCTNETGEHLNMVIVTEGEPETSTILIQTSLLNDKDERINEVDWICTARS